MFKKFPPFLFIVIFFSSFHLAYANLTINEIMYDLSGSDSTIGKSREWVEIYNPDASDVAIDASSWRIYDGSANRTINGQVNFSIPAGAYVIFAGDKDTFLADHADFSGIVYDTGITSLNNTGATLKILDQDGNIIDSVTYASSQGAAGDGNSLQKISGSWLGAAPTLGATNETVSSSSSQSSSSSNENNEITAPNSSGSAPIVNTENTKNTISKKIETKIISKVVTFEGVPMAFDAMTFGYSGEQLYYGKYFWNFGDGDSKEIQSNSTERLTHTYLYSGEYVVMLEYYMNSYSQIPDSVNRIIVKVLGADISISRVGDEKDFFIELANNTIYEADLSNWSLSSLLKTFNFPKNTIISSKKKIIISSSVTHFSVLDKDTLKLITPQGKVIFDYGASAIPAIPVPIEITPKIEVEKIPEKLEKSTENKKETSNDDKETEIVPPEVSVENLEASAVESNSGNSYMPMIASTILVGASAGAVYFIRRNRISGSTAGDDFKILDE